MLYPEGYQPSGYKHGGEGGIRTLDGLLTHTPLAGERLQPLGHLSGKLVPGITMRFSCPPWRENQGSDKPRPYRPWYGVGRAANVH